MSVPESEIARRIAEYRRIIPEGVALVAVSKFQPVEAVKAAWDAGQLRFGESRVQELLYKIPLLPADIEWHFIGHLQTNKVRQLIGKTALIESVDSERLLRIIDEESAKAGIVTDVLLQVHVAQEETKFGFSREELLLLAKEGDLKTLENVCIRGIMAMASNTDDETRVRRDFAEAASIFREVRNCPAIESRKFDILSMGMSGDWEIAVEEGATSVRIGSAIFGAR